MNHIRENLSESFGFRVPDSLERLVLAAQTIDLEKALGSMLAFGEEEWAQGAWRAHAMLGYHTFQPEFFEILSPGEDGIAQGLVVHAPELEQEEYPFFECDPSGFNGDMIFFGPDLFRGLEMLVAHDSCYETRDEPLAENADYAALARELGLSLERKTLIRLSGREHCPVPAVPDGWKFEPCGDMIGALAPRDSFTGEQRGFAYFLEQRAGNKSAALADLVDHSRAMLERGYAGSALLAIRRAWLIGKFDLQKDALESWAGVYRALGRPVLERVVRLQMERWFR